MSKQSWGTRLWNNNKDVIFVLLAIVAFRTFIFDWYRIPSGSMEPTLFNGDLVMANKLKYGPSLPFTDITWHFGQPDRGDIVIFTPPHDSNTFIKRVVGLPGDTIEINGAMITVNGSVYGLPTSAPDFGDAELDIKIHWHHNLAADDRSPDDRLTHRVRHSVGGNLPVITRSIVVPEGKYFVLGDHRTHSHDSRYWGFVEGDNIVADAPRILFSWAEARDDYAILKSLLPAK
jgi:signal peptidase I